MAAEVSTGRTTRTDVPPTFGWSSAAGVAGGTVALGLAELLAGAFVPVPSLVLAVGDEVIDNSPGWLVRFGIETFGTSDKRALTVGIVAASLALAALLGIVAAWRRSIGRCAYAGFAGLAVLAASRSIGTSRPLTTPAAFSAAACGSLAVERLLSLAPRDHRVADAGPGARIGSGGSRRAFLRAAGALVSVGVASAAAGRSLWGTPRAATARAGLVLPRPAQPLPAQPAAGSPEIRGLSPYFTPNDSFYRIDEALAVPDVDPRGWSLKISGLVDQSLEVSLDELLAHPLVEADITLACVSNIVGGDLVGNARWLGVPLVDLLKRAGVRPEADQIIARSVDDFTVGFPVAAAFDGRSALVALGMNGEPLPLSHGFPARLVVAGLYGYVSATKWLAEIELTTFDDYDAYWIRQGWAREGPIKTHSRIDLPRPYAEITERTTTIAGVAWAQARGIREVEVQIDDDEWRTASLAGASSNETWRQWFVQWETSPGPHLIRVRATDGTGSPQEPREREPFPDGATGLHTVAVHVAG